MPRYYFDWDEQGDECGAELADEAAARRYALRLAGELIRDLAPGPPGGLTWRLDVRRADRTPVASLALELRPAGGHLAARPLKIA